MLPLVRPPYRLSLPHADVSFDYDCMPELRLQVTESADASRCGFLGGFFVKGFSTLPRPLPGVTALVVWTADGALPVG